MKRISLFTVLCLSLIVAVILAGCGTKSEGGSIEALSAWARPGLQGGNSAIYLTIQNNTGSTDFLVSATCDAAKTVELHKSMMDNSGTMSMHPLQEIELPSGQSVELKPGGLHVMLIDLQRDLKVNEEIKVTLNFKNSASTTLTAPVKQP